MSENQDKLTGLSEGDRAMLEVTNKPENWLIDVDFDVIPAEEDSAEYSSAVEIQLTDDESPDQIKMLVKQELWKYFWWMNPHWKEKGRPTESVELILRSGRKVELINWSRPLNEKEVSEVKEVIDLFSEIYEGKALESLGYILLDGKPSSEILKTGDLRNGYGELTSQRDTNDGIRLYPNALEGQHRAAEGISNLKGTLIHEATHHIARWNTPLLDDWMERFGWSNEDDTTVQERNSRCITDYATWKADEDVCESIVAKVGNNPALDHEKSMFIQERILEVKTNDGVDVLNIVDGKSVRAPRLPQNIYYKKAPTITIGLS